MNLYLHAQRALPMKADVLIRELWPFIAVCVAVPLLATYVPWLAMAILNRLFQRIITSQSECQ